MKSELPEYLLEEILCRVPATSLNRLRFTCKRWNGLFKDKRFTIKHFEKASKQSLSLMLNDYRLCMLRNNLRRSPHVEVECELNLIDPHSSLDQIEFRRVFHCDGLLLCVTKEENLKRLVVWNPCTGQTRWINRNKQYATYALGSYQDKRSNAISYKILSCNYGGYSGRKEFEIHEINSNSWNILDVPLDLELYALHWGVSLNGKTYWIGRDEKEFLLVSFDYTTERFERLCLPWQYRTLSLSVVREENLSVLLENKITSKIEIWVTNKISESKAVSWSNVLALDLDPIFLTCSRGSFLFDDEKKVLVNCDGKTKEYIVGEDNKVRIVYFEVGSYLSYLFNYVPSLIQI